MKLVIVESPAKCKTIEKYLGSDYKVMASFGHVRDLPTKDGSVKPDEDFAMSWEVSARGKKQLNEMTTQLKNADTLVLATDPDREGEAISWHILDALSSKGKLKDKKIERVVFHEITKSAVTDAIKNPKTIDDNLVSAYLARRALDYLVGFSLSPVLWRKLPGSKSAGRVQSVALRLICERENEIEKFKSEEYWTIDAELLTAKKALIKSRLVELDGKKLEKFDLNSEEKANEAKAKIEAQDFVVEKVERKKANRYPSAPFSTSTLQQDASRKLRFPAKKTMQVAQKLYEEGLITYMRTDAINLSKEAVVACREAIEKYFGQDYLPKQPKEYKNKSKNAQEAHEAIRPTDFLNTPKKMEGKLDADGHKLYELIWKRTVACQMMPAVLDKVVVDTRSVDKQILLRANGQVIEFDGFLKLYQESKDEADEDDENKLLPNVNEGDGLDKGEIKAEQHFTSPPPRFTEASLVKRLEELGIGRPSTYANIIAVLQERSYVRIEKMKFIPEDRGRIVTIFLENYFKKYVEYDFTAQLEEYLDDISNGEMEWKKLLTGFWTKFSKNIEEVSPLKISEVIDKIDEVLEHHLFPAKEDGTNPRLCPDCKQGNLSIKLGKFGAFLGCSNHPDCKYTQPLTGVDGDDEGGVAAPKPEDKILGTYKDMNVYLKKGPYGFYLQLGEDATARTEKPKRVALPKGMMPEDISFEQAERLVALPLDLGEGIELNAGKFGPYIKQGGKSASLKGADTIFSITLERAKELLVGVAEKPQGQTLGKTKNGKEDIIYAVGRYGPYLKVGKKNIALPKEFKSGDRIPTLEEALNLV